jgi:hypothetical protein
MIKVSPNLWKDGVIMSDGDLKRAPLAYENEPFLNSPDGRVLRILSEYTEPISRFRREQIQDTVVFFGSARFHSRAAAKDKLAELEATGGQLSGSQLDTGRKRALAAVDMARYYEDARRLAFLLSEWSIQIPARRRRFVVTTGGGPGSQSRCARSRGEDDRPEYRPAVRADAQSLHHSVA